MGNYEKVMEWIGFKNNERNEILGIRPKIYSNDKDNNKEERK